MERRTILMLAGAGALGLGALWYFTRSAQAGGLPGAGWGASIPGGFLPGDPMGPGGGKANALDPTCPSGKRTSTGACAPYVGPEGKGRFFRPLAKVQGAF